MPKRRIEMHKSHTMIKKREKYSQKNKRRKKPKKSVIDFQRMRVNMEKREKDIKEKIIIINLYTSDIVHQVEHS